MWVGKWREVSSHQVGIVAIGAAIAWMIQSVVSIALPDPTALLDLSMIVPMLLTILGLTALQRLGLSGTGKLNCLAAWILTIAAFTAIPGQICLAFDLDSIKPVIVGVSAVTFVGGLVLTGIAIIHANIAPRWMGIALVLAQPLVMIIAVALSPISPLAESGDYSGAAGHAIVWALIGLSLLEKRLPILATINPGKGATS